MKTIIKIAGLFSLALLFAVFTTGCNKTDGSRTDNMPGDNTMTITQYEKAVALDSGMEGAASVEDIIECIYECINGMPVEDISDSELATLQYVREEEFLARDVYIKMYELYHIPVFNNISKSEFIHTTAMKALLEKYNLPDPGADHDTGVFVNQEIQALYDNLVAQGSASLNDALMVGATIEDVDIYDLIQHINNDVDNEDIGYALSQLWRGSRNHMRAFTAHLTFHGLVYTPQYISQEEFNKIKEGIIIQVKVMVEEEVEENGNIK